MWDPGTYLSFQDERDRPARELLARVPAERPRRVVDLGCGAGTLTGELARRWPDAAVEAFDSSPEMVAEARSRGIDAHVGDVRAWEPGPDADVVFCNAVLHWVPGHVDLLRTWLDRMPSGSCFAFQVPGNFGAPSHALARELAAQERWRERLAGAVPGEDVVSDAVDYADRLTSGSTAVDAWETTYVHALRGDDPVLRWISGAGLRPVRAVLGEDEWTRFTAELAPRLRAAYPRRDDGVTWFPFRRVFALLHRM
ncbi:trans-aconitate 2-methyltransferase [Salinifilum aidingensis]